MPEYVIINCHEYGSYIGEVIGRHIVMRDTWVQVKIISCVRYPSQFAVLYRDIPVQREPYPAGTIKQSDSWQSYSGENLNAV